MVNTLSVSAAGVRGPDFPVSGEAHILILAAGLVFVLDRRGCPASVWPHLRHEISSRHQWYDCKPCGITFTFLQITVNVLTVKISQDLEREINRAARRERISKSELARRAMVQYVARRDRSRKLLSAAELAGDLIGSIRGTPLDLSCNPRYLRDLGQ